MLPFAFEWQWDIGHIIFFGLFYAALAVIGAGLTVAFISNLKELYAGGGHGHHEETEESEDVQEEAKPAKA